MNGNDVFNGSQNVLHVVVNELSPAIIASRLRFIPLFAGETLCACLEFYGCPYTGTLHLTRLLSHNSIAS